MSTTIPTANARLVWTAQPDPGGGGNICTDDILQILGPQGNVVSWIDYLGFGGGDLAGGGSGTVQQILAGTGISIGGTTANPVVTNTGVTQLTVGAGLSENASSGFVTLANTGVTSLAVGTGLKESASTGGVTLNNTQPTPWVDIQNYGGIPKPNALITATTSVNTTGGLPNITVGSALPYFQNGAGVCIWQAGAATAQSTPSAPSITSPPVSGSQTITYKVVGVDSMGGLTAASAAGTVSGPAIFSPKPVAITSATATSNTVTVNFAAPLNTTVVAGMTIHIVGLTGSGISWDGVWTIASAPTTSQITFTLTGATGSATTTNATGRLSNTQLLTALTRDSSGVIHGTTSQNHNFNVGTVAQPTIVIIEGVLPYDLCGHFVIASTPTATSFTCNTGNCIPETGVITTNGQFGSFGQSINASSATVWEYTYVNCPAYSGTTNAYYIYSDNVAPGGALNLIGKTLAGERHFTDWGPNYGNNFSAPAYVPTAPPVSAQNQLFATTILSGGGTTSMILAANVPSQVTGGTIMYDDGPCLTAASSALPSLGGQIILSPPQPFNSVTNPVYIFNSPVNIPTHREIIVASSIYANETIYLTSYDSIVGSRAATFEAGGEFSATMAPYVRGAASPLIQFGNTTGQTSGVRIENIFVLTGAVTSNNGQYGVVLNGCFYNQIRDCIFASGTNQCGTCVALVLNGPCVSTEIRNIAFGGTGAYGLSAVLGQSNLGPCVGSIVCRASDNPAFSNLGIDKFVLNGVNTGSGRGIMFDGQYGFAGEAYDFQINQIWIQGTSTPSVMFSGFVGGAGAPTYVRVHDITNDTSPCAVLANWSAGIRVAELHDCNIAGMSFAFVTGNAVQGLIVSAIGTQVVGQTLTTSKLNTGNQNVGSVVSSGTQGVLVENTIAQSLGVGGVIFAPVLPTSAGVAAVTSGAGTIPAGAHIVTVSFIGWEGGETAQQESVSVTVNGSQGVQVSWTQPSGFQGAYIYFDGYRNNTIYTSSPQTFTSLSGITGFFLGTQIDGTGLPLINTVEIITPTLIMPSGVNKLTAVAPTMTGNRTLSLADGTQSTIISGTLSTSSASSTTLTLQGVTASSHVTFSPTNSAAATMMLSAPGIYISSISANTVVFTHASSLAGATFSVSATVN